MKKIYLLSLASMLALGLHAQNASLNPKMTQVFQRKIGVQNTPTEKNTAIPQTVNNSRAVIWSEDFGTTTNGGIPANWTAGGANPGWKKSFSGSNGPFSGGSPTFASSSFSNGALIYDADSINNSINPQPTPPTGAGYGPLTGSVTSNDIDLTGQTNIKLEFQQLFRYCCSLSEIFLTVSVSGNGGASWTDFDVKGLTTVNNTPANPTFISLNISAIAGNSPNARIKFTFESSTGVYYWQIDDIAIVEGAQNDIVLERDYTDFLYKDGGYYGQTPLGQVGPIGYRAAIINNGGVPQSNVKLDVNITGAATAALQSNILTSMPVLVRDTLLIENTTGYTPTATGTYNVSFNVSQDETDSFPSNNIATRKFLVTDSIYARDFNTTTAATTSTISTSDYVGGDVDGAMLANLYDFPVATSIRSASAFIASSTTIGTNFDFVLFENTATDLVEVATTAIYDVDAANKRNKWVTLPFIGGPYPTDADKSYYIAIRCFGQSTTSSINLLSDRSLENLQPIGTTALFITAWGGVASASPLLRLNVESPASISELSNNQITVSQNRPNPAVNFTSISYTNTQKSNVSIEITDVTGKVVFTEDLGVKNPGQYNYDMELSSFDAGVYFYTLNTNKSKVTKMMSVIK
jgi:hypothetical protein